MQATRDVRRNADGRIYRRSARFKLSNSLTSLTLEEQMRASRHSSQNVILQSYNLKLVEFWCKLSFCLFGQGYRDRRRCSEIRRHILVHLPLNRDITRPIRSLIYVLRLGRMKWRKLFLFDQIKFNGLVP